ncbi:MAG: ABC transporter substrate-binding protein [Desulfobacterales bacterium]
MNIKSRPGPLLIRVALKRLAALCLRMSGCIFLAALLLLPSGCSEKKQRLTFWVGGAPQEVDYWEELVAEFEASAGIAVEVIRQPAATDQRKQGLVIALASARPDPDVFLMDIIWVKQFVQSHWLEPLDRFFADDSPVQPRLFFPGVIEAVDRHENIYYALPAFMDVGVLYYRTDLLQDYGFEGPPVTWEALVQQSLHAQEEERRRNPGFNGFIWQGAQYEGLVCTFLEFAATHGGGLTADGALDLTRGGTLSALQFMQDLIQRYRISPPNTYTEMQEEEVRRSFQRGNALFERNWLYAWNLHQQPGSAVRGRVGLAPLPHSPGAQTAATLGGWHLGISKSSDAKESAWRLVAFLLSHATQKKLMLKLGWYSARRDLYAEPAVRRAVPHVDVLEHIVAKAVSRPDLAYYDQVSRVIQRSVNACLAGKRAPAEAISIMQRDIAKIEGFYGGR